MLTSLPTAGGAGPVESWRTTARFAAATKIVAVEAGVATAGIGEDVGSGPVARGEAFGTAFNSAFMKLSGYFDMAEKLIRSETDGAFRGEEEIRHAALSMTIRDNREMFPATAFTIVTQRDRGGPIAERIPANLPISLPPALPGTAMMPSSVPVQATPVSDVERHYREWG